MFLSLAKFFQSKEKTLSQALHPTKRVKIEGIIFEIRKINPLDYMAGYKVVAKCFDIYSKEDSQAQADLTNIDKIKKHYADIFSLAVISPRIARKEGEEGLQAEALLMNWDIAEKLYEEIISFSYGKKKIQQLMKLQSSQRKG